MQIPAQSIYSSGAHMSSSFSYIICIFTQKVSAFDQQCVNGNLHTAALCRNMHILYENVFFQSFICCANTIFHLSHSQTKWDDKISNRY